MAVCANCGQDSGLADRCASCGAAVQSVDVEPGWTVVAATGPLVLVQSASEYVVHDQQTTFGRWPLSPDGYGFALQTYQAHAQSLAHGVAYTATGYRDPAGLGLPTEPVLKSQTYAAPLSFVGSTRRILGWARNTAQRSPLIATLAWISAVLFTLLAWTFILCWYLVIFGLFGIFVIPFRLMRRSSRKNLHVQRTALATQQAMYKQQATIMQQMAQQQAPLNYGQPAPAAPPPPLPPPPPNS
jgi:hypothetical protein